MALTQKDFDDRFNIFCKTNLRLLSQGKITFEDGSNLVTGYIAAGMAMGFVSPNAIDEYMIPFMVAAGLADKFTKSMGPVKDEDEEGDSSDPLGKMLKDALAHPEVESDEDETEDTDTDTEDEDSEGDSSDDFLRHLFNL